MSLDCIWIFLDKNLKRFLEARFMDQGQERIKAGMKSLHSDGSGDSHLSGKIQTHPNPTAALLCNFNKPAC